MTTPHAAPAIEDATRREFLAALGTAELPHEPKRVVTISDHTEFNSLDALSRPPAATALLYDATTFQPWIPTDHLNAVETFPRFQNLGDDLNAEAVAARQQLDTERTSSANPHPDQPQHRIEIIGGQNRHHVVIHRAPPALPITHISPLGCAEGYRPAPTHRPSQEDSDSFQRFPAVRDGRVVELDDDHYTSLFITPARIPWAADNAIPKILAALGS